MSFENFKLHPVLLASLNKCGFMTPSSIQEKALAYANFPVDMIIAAKTVITIFFFLAVDLATFKTFKINDQNTD
jgi:hypothetical protein